EEFRLFSRSWDVCSHQDSALTPSTRGRPGPGIAARLGQPSKADSPPQRIHALLSAIPGPDRPLVIQGRGFETAAYRSVAGQVAVSRALAPRGRGKQDMDVLRASQGRESVDGLRGMPRIHAS